MGASDVIALAGQLGFPGILVGYLLYRESAERKDTRHKLEREYELSKARIEADLELARAMTLLTVTIRGSN